MTTIARGKVYFVGAGPGDPELLTVKADALVRHAEIILHDDLVTPTILALAAPQSMAINVGKRCGTKKITQVQIHELMISSARRGMSVVRLKSGDPAIFGRLGEEIDALNAAGVNFEIVPGVTAALAAASAVGASLTDRRKSSRVLLASGHHAVERKFVASADVAALVHEDTTLAIYMPGHDFSRIRKELLDAALSPETPCVIVSRASTANERTFWTTISRLEDAPVLETPTVLLIGRTLESAAQHASSSQSVLKHLHLPTEFLYDARHLDSPTTIHLKRSLTP
jgi:uroporphyrin-III C-methyltransferase